MARLHLVCYAVAFIAFLLASWGVPSRINLLALGLALLTLTLLF